MSLSLSSRGYRDSDFVAIAELFNAATRVTGGHPGSSPAEAHGLFDALVLDPATDSRVLLAPDGALVAVGIVPTPPGAGVRVDLIGGVHPDWWDQGIGRDLLGWQLRRTGEIRQAAGHDAVWQAQTGANSEDKGAQRLYRRFGMEPVRYWLEMCAPTASVPDVPLSADLRSADVRVIEYAPEYANALYTTHMSAFADHWGFQRRPMDRWSLLTVGSETFRPDLSRLALHDGEIVSYVLGYDDPQADRLYIGQVGTVRPWRRRGIAAALLADVLTGGAKHGKTTASLGVDADSPTGAVGVYERVGFTAEFRGVTYQINLTS